MTGEFPEQMASNAENISIWWRHHGKEDNVIQIGPRYLEEFRQTSSDENMCSRTSASIVSQTMMMIFLLQIVSGFA